jgi:hypothetical protein
MQKIIAVVGGREVPSELLKVAFEVGKGIAERGYALVCGGMGGVMEEACRGAKSTGGLTIGILPGPTKSDANPYVDIPILTSMSHARNAIVVRTADAVIAIGGKYGTLSEIGLALAISRKVVGVGTWEIPGVKIVSTPEEVFKELGI